MPALGNFHPGIPPVVRPADHCKIQHLPHLPLASHLNTSAGMKTPTRGHQNARFHDLSTTWRQRRSFLPRKRTGRPAYQIRFYIGQGTPQAQAARLRIEEQLTARFHGWTRFDADGGWVDDGGRFCKETACVYEVLTDQPDISCLAARLAARLAVLAGESSVLYTLAEVQGGFSEP